MSIQINGEEYLTTRQFADKHDVPISTVYGWISMNKIPSIKIKNIRFIRSDTDCPTASSFKKHINHVAISSYYPEYADDPEFVPLQKASEALHISPVEIRNAAVKRRSIPYTIKTVHNYKIGNTTCKHIQLYAVRIKDVASYMRTKRINHILQLSEYVHEYDTERLWEKDMAVRNEITCLYDNCIKPRHGCYI